MKRLEALVPLGVGRVLLTTESDTGLGAVDVAVLNSNFSHFAITSRGSDLFTFRNFLNVKRLEALVPLGVGRVLLTQSLTPDQELWT